MKTAMRIQQRKRLLTLFLVTVCLTLIVLIVVFSLIFNSVTLNFNTRIPETAPKPLVEGGGNGTSAIPGVPGTITPGRALPTDIRVQAPTDEAPAPPRRPASSVPAMAPGTSGAVPTVKPADLDLPNGPDVDVPSGAAPTPERPIDIRVQPPAPTPRPTPPQATAKPTPLPPPTPVAAPPARRVPPPTDVRGVGSTHSGGGEPAAPPPPLPPVPGRG